MTKLKIEVQFPCGYKLKFEVNGFLLRDFSGLPCIEECPIHGKKCKKEIKK